MKNEARVSLWLFLSISGGLLSGCDDAESSADEQALKLLAERDVTVWPPLDAGPEQRAEPDAEPTMGTIAAPETDEPISFGDVSPKKHLLKGWVRWALEQPWADGPVLDTTGEHCGDGQSGPIWYLAGTTGGPVERECTIPKNKKLFFPLINVWCIYPAEFYPDKESMAERIAWTEGFYAYEHENTCSLTLRIDGQDVLPDFETMDEELYIAVIKPFQVTLHEQNLWADYGYDFGGENHFSGAGHYALIDSLPPGDHVLEFGGESCGEYPFSTFATYYLHVEG